jgi:putative restriction endonuclease
MTPLEQHTLRSVLQTNGFHAEISTIEKWVAGEATYALGRCFLSADWHQGIFFVATSIAAVAEALFAEGHALRTDIVAPSEATLGVFAVRGEANLHIVVRRAFQLSLALPTAPLDRFVAQTRALPRSTEAERLVVQRVGQDIFRDALMEYWSGRCAVTGIDQPELLRASHSKPWANSTDAERLDVYNGFLLLADIDAAFDCGLITFRDDGIVWVSDKMRASTRSRFENLQIPSTLLLTDAHRNYLSWHRTNKFQR